MFNRGKQWPKRKLSLRSLLLSPRRAGKRPEGKSQASLAQPQKGQVAGSGCLPDHEQLNCAGPWAPGPAWEGLPLSLGIGPQAPAGPSASLRRRSEGCHHWGLHRWGSASGGCGGCPCQGLGRRLLTQAKAVGLLCEDHAEPAGLLTLEDLAEGQQHLIVQETAPEQTLLLKGALAQVLGGWGKGLRTQGRPQCPSPAGGRLEPRRPPPQLTFLRSTQM